MIYFIGAGPGAADLITVKGKEVPTGALSSYSKAKEPLIYFHHQDDTKQSIHPINGLKIY